MPEVSGDDLVDVPEGPSKVRALTDSTFEDDTQATTGSTTGPWLVEFYAPWYQPTATHASACPHTQQSAGGHRPSSTLMATSGAAIARSWRPHSKPWRMTWTGRSTLPRYMCGRKGECATRRSLAHKRHATGCQTTHNRLHSIMQVDATANSMTARRFDVKGYPTVLMIHDGEYYKYAGSRSRTDLIRFAKVWWPAMATNIVGHSPQRSARGVVCVGGIPREQGGFGDEQGERIKPVPSTWDAMMDQLGDEFFALKKDLGTLFKFKKNALIVTFTAGAVVGVAIALVLFIVLGGCFDGPAPIVQEVQAAAAAAPSTGAGSGAGAGSAAAGAAGAGAAGAAGGKQARKRSGKGGKKGGKAHAE